MTVVYEILFIPEILCAKKLCTHTLWIYYTYTQKLVVSLDNVTMTKEMNDKEFGLYTVSGLNLEAIEIIIVLHYCSTH